MPTSEGPANVGRLVGMDGLKCRLYDLRNPDDQPIIRARDVGVACIGIFLAG